MRARSLLAVVLVAACLLGSLTGGTALGEKKKKGRTYKPPYKNGPQGGDEWNYIERDRKSGTVRIFRVFPGFSPVVGCEPEPAAAWSMLRARHRVAKPVKAVTAKFSAMLDPYSWLTVGARTAKGKWLGVRKLQGPFEGSRKLKVRLFQRPSRGDRMWIEFGLQLGDSCPQVSGAEAEFASMKVHTR